MRHKYLCYYPMIASAPAEQSGRIRKSVRLVGMLVAVLASLFTTKVFAQSYHAVDVAKLLSYASRAQQTGLEAELRNRLGAELRGAAYPLYIVIPIVHAESQPAEPEKISESMPAEVPPTPGIFLIYKKDFPGSSISGETALFMQVFSENEELSAPLIEIVKRRPREVFDGDLVVLGGEDLEDLRRIISINKGEAHSDQVQQFKAVRNFIEKSWDRKNLVLGSLHPTQFTLVTGMKGGMNDMTIIHCLPNTVGPLPAVHVGLDMQQVVREFFEIVQGSSIPVSLRMKVESIGMDLKQEQIGEISRNLDLVLRKDNKEVTYEPSERRVDGENVTLLALVPRSFLRGGAVSVALRSNQFAFVDPESEQRVNNVEIAAGAWWQDESEDGLGKTIQIVEVFNSGGETHEDFRRYVVPLRISADLGRPECREGLNSMASSQSRGQGRGSNTTSVRARLVCFEAWKYLAAILQEIRIAALLKPRLNVLIVLDEPSTRWLRLPRRTREVMTIIRQYLRSEAESIGLAESAVQEMIRVGQRASERGIEIRLIEGGESP